jgi:signal transduction histidine kinase/ActR/RegA family two-component response regulator
VTRRPYRDWSIRRKIALLIAAASVTGVALAAIAVTAYDLTTFRHRAVRDAATFAAILGSNTVPALLFNDSSAARENLATLEHRPEFAAAAVYRPNGSPFAAYQRPGASPLAASPPFTAGVVTDPDHLVLTTALQSDDQTIGWLRLRYDLPTLLQRLPQYAVVATVVVMAVGTTAVLLLTALSRLVAVPLRGLARTFGRLTETRDLTLRVPQHASDEMGALATAFNRMLDTLQERDAALQRSEARLRLALAAAQMETWGGDAPSSALAELVRRVHPDDRAAVQQTMDQALAAGSSVEIEFRSMREREERITALRGQAVKDSDGTSHLVGVALDVTDRRRLERQLLESQKMEAIGNLAGGIAHDFNNLLTGMLGYLTFARKALPPDSPVAADVEQVERAAKRAAALTSQLLSYARRQMVSPSVLDMNESVRTLEPLLRRLLGETVTVTIAITEPLRRVRIDAGQLEQVIVNLAINARDAMPEGGTLTLATRTVTVGAADAVRRGLAAGDYVELAAMDTGTGIPSDIVDRIFEPFFTTKPQGQGTGLGLSVCYGIAKQAKGDLWVETTVGKGSTFRLLLPSVATPATSATADPSGDTAGGTETILLVEDDAAVRELAARALREAGYRVLEAENGPAAIAVAGATLGTIDLLLTDVVMPGQSGGALASELRGTRPSLPVLFISGYPDDTVRSGVVDSEASFLAKPFAPGDLRLAVRKAVDAAKRASA